MLQVSLRHGFLLMGSILNCLELEELRARKHLPAESPALSMLPVSAQTIIQCCLLIVPPSHVPAGMDGKDMILAALQFLCASPSTSTDNCRNSISMSTATDFDSISEYRNDLLGLLPLVRHTASSTAIVAPAVSEMEEQFYVKTSSWTYRQLVTSGIVDQLEELFLGSLPLPFSQVQKSPLMARRQPSGFAVNNAAAADGSTKNMWWIGRGYFLPGLRRSVRLHYGESETLLKENEIGEILRYGTCWEKESEAISTKRKKIS
jgi:hypothetical protein